MKNNKTYIVEAFDENETKYYFDINTDTSKNSSEDVSDSPIDARIGATLQDKRVVNMETVGISGKFSDRATNNTSFSSTQNRIAVIVDYFEDALAKNKIYRVCKKGTIYENMMLDKVVFKFGEYISTVEVSLSFVEVVIIGWEGTKKTDNPEEQPQENPSVVEDKEALETFIDNYFDSIEKGIEPPEVYFDWRTNKVLVAIKNPSTNPPADLISNMELKDDVYIVPSDPSHATDTIEIGGNSIGIRQFKNAYQNKSYLLKGSLTLNYSHVNLDTEIAKNLGMEGRAYSLNPGEILVKEGTKQIGGSNYHVVGSLYLERDAYYYTYLGTYPFTYRLNNYTEVTQTKIIKLYKEYSRKITSNSKEFDVYPTN